MQPTLDEKYEELDSILQELQEKHDNNLFFWHVALTDTQNALLIGDLGSVRTHITSMYDTISSFRISILKAECKLNAIEDLTNQLTPIQHV